MKKIFSFLFVLFGITSYAQEGHLNGARLNVDSVHIGLTTAPIADSIDYFGCSTVTGVGASSDNTRWTTQASQRLKTHEVNFGVNSQLITIPAVPNPYGAATTGLQDTTEIPIYVPGFSRDIVESWFKNDVSWTGTNSDTVHFKADLRLWIAACENRGWPSSKIVLASDGPEGQNAWNADSVTYTLPSAATLARCVMYDSAVAALSREKSTLFIDLFGSFMAYGQEYLLRASDSIHNTDAGYHYEANCFVNALGYLIPHSGQQFASNGIVDLDSARLHLSIPATSSVFTPVVIDSTNRLRGCDNCFPVNNPLQQQPLQLNFMGATTTYLNPNYMAVTGLRPASGIPGLPISLGAMWMEYTAGTGYIDSYNYGTSTAGTLNLGFAGGNINVGSGAAQYNAAQLSVTGIFDVSGAAWFNSTSATTGARYLNGFFDGMASGGTFTFRTNGTNNTNLKMLANSNNVFGGPTIDSAAVIQSAAGTSTNAQVYLPPGTIMTTPKNGSMTHVNGHLWFTDQGTNYDLLAGAGATPTLQQVLTAGSTMTGTNAVALGGNLFSFTGGNVGVGATATSSTLFKLGAATTSVSSLNLTSSATVNPTAPNSGDLWWNGTNLYFYNGSANKDLLAGGGGGSPGGSTNNVQVNSSSSFVGAANLNYDVSNLWTLFGSSPTIGTSTGAPAAGDLIVKTGNRWVSTSSANTIDNGSIGFTNGAIWEFKNYFTNTSSSAFDFYTAPATTGTITRALGISTNQVIYTGAANPTYGTPVGGDVFIPYGGRLVSGFSSTIWSSFSPNHAGIMELKDAYTSGAITFYPSGNGTTPVLGATLNTIGNLIVNSTGIDSAAFIQTGTPTSTNANAYFPPGTIMTTPKNGSLTHVNGHLWFTDQGTNYDLLAGAGATPTLQQVLTAGGTLTSNHTITLGGNTLAFSGLVGPPSTFVAVVHSTASDSGTYQVPLAYGTYTPTLTNTTNITSSTVNQAATYTRIGNIIHVNIACIITPTTASTATVLTFTLPFTTSNGSPVNIGSAALDINSGGVGTYTSGIVSLASTTTATLSFNCTSLAGSSNVNIQFDYSL